jgi:lauroyl/myristoyl acyltransferase
MIDTVVYFLARTALALIGILPLKLVAVLGRAGGAITFYADARHRKVAIGNLELCFGAEMSASEIRSLARENFKRIGEAFACGVKTATMSSEVLEPHLTFAFPGLDFTGNGQSLQSLVVAIGHFGNFELYSRVAQAMKPYRALSTYRALRQPKLNFLLQELRNRSGCQFFERRTEGVALRRAMSSGGVVLGLLADQNAGGRGLPAEFMGHPCSTSAAPALYALRHKCRLLMGICFRKRLGQWHIDLTQEIATHEAGKPRPLEAIMRDVNLHFEKAVRRDPANWFWVHNRWKASRKAPARATPNDPVSKADALPIQ